MSDVFDELAGGLNDEERETLDELEAGLRRNATPVSLYINGTTGEMYSPDGSVSDAYIVERERIYRESVERYRREFGGTSPDGPPAA